MHCENPGGGSAVGTQSAPGSRQVETPWPQARANVLQDVAPLLGGSAATGLHALWVMVSGPIVNDLGPMAAAIALSVLQLIGAGSRPEKS